MLALVMAGLVCGAGVATAEPTLAPEQGPRAALERELEATDATVRLGRGLAALEHQQAGLDYSIAVLQRRRDEQRSRLQVYSQVQTERRTGLRARARALYKLAHGGMGRLLFGEALGAEAAGASARRVSRGRILADLVRHDLRELASHRSARARAERELAASETTLTMLRGMKNLGRVEAEALALRHSEAEAARTEAQRHSRKARRAAKIGDWPAYRAVLAEVRERWRDLAQIDGLWAYKGLRAPVAGSIVGRFGSYEDATTHVPMERVGVEIRARRDEKVVAIAPGEVVLVTEVPGYGEAVVIDHGAAEHSMAARLWKVAVRAGDRVEAGTVLGHVGFKPVDDGLGTTVYFEVRQGERPVDPQGLLARARR